MSGERWLTREDILEDLRVMDSGFDQYVVGGGRPPPVHREIVDEEEVSLLCGGPRTSTIVQGAERTSPDLEGITQMLHLVNELENSDEGETKTLYRNTETEEICISKLNPKVDEFVPSGSSSLRPQAHKVASKPSKPSRNTRNKSPKPPAEVRGSKDKARTQNSSSEAASHADVLHVLLNEAADLNKQFDVSKMSLNDTDKKVSKVVDSSIDDANEIFDVSKKNLNETEKMLIEDSNEQLDVSKTNLNEIVNMRSKIIDSSNDCSLQKRKVKNVAMASLMKLCTTTSTATPKISRTTPPVDILSKTLYFEDKPSENGGNKVEAQRISPVFPEPNAVYQKLAVEDSISKVNDWFHSADKPKAPPARMNTGRATVVGGPRQLDTLAAKPRPPDSFDGFALKRKTTSVQSVTSGPSEQISKRELREPAAFVPSGYASDLLQKYQSYAENTKSNKNEDWGTKLERELKEKEEKMKKKLLEKQNDSSSGTGQDNL